MDKVHTSTHWDLLNFNMRRTFLVCQHIRRKVHTSNNDSHLIMNSFLEKNRLVFLGDGMVDNIQPQNVSHQNQMKTLETNKFQLELN